jgi:ketosteroid isomerase-like protein
MHLPLKILLALTFLSLSVSNADGHLLAIDSQLASDSAPTAVQKRAEQFIEAFINLDWERFRSFFATDATAFFPPSAQFPRRANGKAEIEQVFRAVFEAARRRKSSPPYLNIEPKEMKVQMLGDVAIVTFHLEDPDMFGRRTIIFQRQGRQWLIVHLHASGILVPK